jgi:hypothetical protein
MDFVAEWTELQQPTPDTILDHWKIYFDGLLKLGGASAGVLFISKDKKTTQICSSNPLASYEQ